MSKPVEDPEKRLTSDRFEEFFEAVDVLYIKNNLGGRNNFAAAWPDAAQHIFGEELMAFDREGAPDKERRARLEEEAESRRVDLLESIGTLEEKSVDKGVLQVEYVQALVNKLGRKLALNVYSRWLVNRFIPPPPGEEPPPPPPGTEMKVEVAPVETAPQPPPVTITAPPRAPLAPGEDPMDRIRPISVEPDMSPLPEPDPEPLPQQAAPPPPPAPEPQRQHDTAMKQFAYEEPEGAGLFVAGQPPQGQPGAAPPLTDELIVETEGGSGMNISTAPEQQESIAPVVGAPKKSGLKIMSIAENDPDDPNKQ